MKKDKQKIGVFITVYSLFLYYLINNVNEEDIIILTHNIPENIKNNIKHIDLPPIGFYDIFKTNPQSLKERIIKIIIIVRYILGYLKLRIILSMKCFNKDVEIWGQTHTPFSYMFYTYNKSFIIEDGLLNYITEPKPISKTNSLLDSILHVFGIYTRDIPETLGTHENIKKIYYTHECPFEIIKNKVTVIDINQLWDKKTYEEQRKILKKFEINDNFINKIDDDYYLLLTGGYAERGMISFDEEIQIYQELIGNKEKIIIKPHPIDQKDYSKIFPKALIFNKEFPIELMELIGVDIKNILVVNSTAVLNFKNSNTIIYSGKTSCDEINYNMQKLAKIIYNKNYK